MEADELSREPNSILGQHTVKAGRDARALPQRWRRLREEALGWRPGAEDYGAGSRPADELCRLAALSQRLRPAWPWQAQEQHGITAA